MKTLLCSLLAGTLFAGSPAILHAVILTGDIALIGWNDSGSPDDMFTFVTLANIPAGESVYFTDNGWTGTQYRGAGLIDGDGNESVLKWTATATIQCGRVFNNLTNGAGYVWTRTQSIPNGGTGVPGTTEGSFSDLGLGATSGDQINVFQGNDANNPLFNNVRPIFLLDDTNGFEPAIDNGTGGVPTGLTQGTTALTFGPSFTAATVMQFRLNSRPVGPSGLPEGTKPEWLAAIANPANWTLSSNPNTPLQPALSTSSICVPEPTAFLALITGTALLFGRRRRHA